MININIDVAELDILIKHRKVQIADAMAIISQNRDCEETEKAGKFNVDIEKSLRSNKF